MDRPGTTPDNGARVGATIAGLGLLGMAGLAGYANLGILARAADASAAELAFATVAMGVVAALDVVVGVGLHLALRAGAPRTSAAAMGLRVAYAALLAAAVGALLSDGDGVARASAFYRIFEPALGLFGVHLLVLAAAGLPRWLAALVALAGFGYAWDALAPALGAPGGLGAYTFFGELALMGWLLLRAIRGG